MGRTLSRFFQSGSALLSAGNHRGISEETRKRVRTVFDALRANPRVTVQRLEGLLSQIPKNENILLVHNEEGYNLLQKCVGINNVELVRWILARNIDLNRGACSLPLHIACYKGYEECVNELLKHGARLDVEARMCWPGPHSQNCEERGKYMQGNHDETSDRGSDKLQTAMFYAIDGDQVHILQLLMKEAKSHATPFTQKRPLLHIACERAAFACVKHLATERSEEINMCYDEYYPVHHAVLHPVKFLNVLIAHHAEMTVVTTTEQMTLLHILFLLSRKSADETLQTCKVLLEHGLRELINQPDSLGNTPLHGLIVRYALEESRYGYQNDNQPWNKWDMMHLVRYLLQNGARPSINQQGNSALAYVLRHIKDLEFRYDLLNMLLQEGGNPNVAGRDGSVPLMVCLVPLINKDPLNQFTHSMKVKPRSRHILHNIVEMVKNTRIPSDIDNVYDLMLTLIQYGADPNVNITNDCPSTSSSSFLSSAKKSCTHVFYYYVTLISSKEELLNDPHLRFARILQLFHMCMDHEPLYTCVHVATTQLGLQAPSKGTLALLQVLRDMSAAPRTLKQLTRVCIYKALQRKPGMFISKLGLPAVLKDYLLNFEP